MRPLTIAATALAALSTAALAQVAQTPAEQKNIPPNAAIPDNGTVTGSSSSEAGSVGNATATPAGGKTEPASPRR